MNHYQIRFIHDDRPRSYYAGNVHTALARATKHMTVRSGLVLSLKVTNLGKHDHDWRPVESMPGVRECVSGCGRQSWRKN